ncbi:MAG: hypothetical protein ATN31_10780 [Candidatus Epulonipiscioides saccharophilum]|nr:MAG: hypothetical protein ATN31_10780 [Epulopiscium sp. AS2M-Bin001]
MDLFILLSRYIITSLAIVIFILILGREKIETKVNLPPHLLYNTMIIFFSLAMIIIGIKYFKDIKPLFINWLLITIMITTFYSLIKDKLEVRGSIIVFLIIISMIMLNRLDVYEARQQLMYLTISLMGAAIVYFLFPMITNKHMIKLYIPGLIILLLLPFLLGKRIYGAYNWVDLKFISFQPSEIGKIAYGMIAGYLLTEKKIKKQSIWIVFFLTSIISIIFVLQKDLGAAFLYMGVFLILYYIHTLKLSHLIIGGLACGLSGIIFIATFSHVRKRILSWLDPFSDIWGAGYQMAQGLFAMGTWGPLGSGLALGTPRSIPFVTTDFIFTAIVEELGVIIGCLIILSYFCIGMFGAVIATELKNRFLQYIAIVYTSFITLQAFVILAGVLQIIPLTGVTLPFISAGGSSILSSTIMIVILFSLPIYDKKRKKAKRKVSVAQKGVKKIDTKPNPKASEKNSMTTQKDQKIQPNNTKSNPKVFAKNSMTTQKDQKIQSNNTKPNSKTSIRNSINTENINKIQPNNTKPNSKASIRNSANIENVKKIQPNNTKVNSKTSAKTKKE